MVDNLDFIPSEEELDEDNTVILIDDDGNEVEFEFLDLIDYNGKSYAVLLADDDDVVTILEVQESEDGETDDLFSVEDDAILEAVFEIFKEKFSEFFDFAE